MGGYLVAVAWQAGYRQLRILNADNYGISEEDKLKIIRYCMY